MVVTCCELLVMLWGLSQWVKLHCKASPQHSFRKSTKPTSMYVLPMMIHFIMNFPHGYLPRYYLKCAVVSDSPSQIKKQFTQHPAEGRVPLHQTCTNQIYL